jgi:hypothetical protein
MNQTTLIALGIIGAAVLFVLVMRSSKPKGLSALMGGKGTQSPMTTALLTIAAIVASRRFGLFGEAKSVAADVGKVFTGDPTSPASSTPSAKTPESTPSSGN